MFKAREGHKIEAFYVCATSPAALTGSGSVTQASRGRPLLERGDRAFPEEARARKFVHSVGVLLVAGILLLAFSSVQMGQATVPANQPVARTDSNSQTAHRQLLDKAKAGHIDIYFEGDSIVRRWGATDYPEMLANWKQNFFGWNAGNFGWGADTTQNILWRLNNGELDGVNPKIIVLLAGTNNVGRRVAPGSEEAIAADVTSGIRAILDVMRRKAPGAVIVLMGIFPRNDNIAVMPAIDRINANISAFADGKTILYLNINDKLADKTGTLYDGMMVDKLHPTVKGYQVWADALKPIFTSILGQPAKEDHAPPPTGDPSAQIPQR